MIAPGAMALSRLALLFWGETRDTMKLVGVEASEGESPVNKDSRRLVDSAATYYRCKYHHCIYSSHTIRCGRLQHHQHTSNPRPCIRRGPKQGFQNPGHNEVLHTVIRGQGRNHGRSVVPCRRTHSGILADHHFRTKHLR